MKGASVVSCNVDDTFQRHLRDSFFSTWLGLVLTEEDRQMVWS